jgi:hypothetical protein
MSDFKPTKCKSINCSHIAYSRRVVYSHRKVCKVEMSFQEHPGYEHMKAIVGGSKKYACGYYQLLVPEKRELLRGCLANFQGELNEKKRRYEELQKIADKLEKHMGAANMVRELSSDSDAESPRDKRAKTREVSKAAEPAAASSSWTLFGRGAQPPPPPASV